MNLRDYQQQAIDNVMKAFETHDRVMLQMPTGTGKTEVFCEIIKKQPNRKLILVHRKELVKQIHERLLKKCSLNASLILSGDEGYYNPNNQVQVASIATLMRRGSSYYPKNVSLIVVDEAHHAKAKTYQTILEHYKNQSVKLLGVTATPCRLNGQGFSDNFDILVKSWSIKQFIEKDYLAGFKHWATSSPDFSKIKINKVTNDYNEHDLSLLMSEDKIMSDLIESYIK